MSDAQAWNGASIPVFASTPSKLDADQRASQHFIYGRLHSLGLEPRTLGSTDPGVYNPLHEVRTLARHCAGGIILGYSQITADRAHRFNVKTLADGTIEVEKDLIRKYRAPTPWNQLETGILFGLGMPLFVLRQEGIEGGIFDAGSSDVLVHSMPMPAPPDASSPLPQKVVFSQTAESSFTQALLRWQGLVRDFYYGRK